METHLAVDGGLCSSNASGSELGGRGESRVSEIADGEEEVIRGEGVFKGWRRSTLVAT